MRGYWVDIAAVGFFAMEWTVYAFTLERTAYGRDSLSARNPGRIRARHSASLA